MDDTYIDISGKLLGELRILIEGAVSLYEDDAIQLNRLALQNGMLNAAIAFDTIGVALYGIHTRICTFQDAYLKEATHRNG